MTDGKARHAIPGGSGSRHPQQHKTPGKPGHAASAPERHGKSGSAEPRDKPGSTASDSARKWLRINTRNRTAKSPAHKISDTLVADAAACAQNWSSSRRLSQPRTRSGLQFQVSQDPADLGNGDARAGQLPGDQGVGPGCDALGRHRRGGCHDLQPDIRPVLLGPAAAGPVAQSRDLPAAGEPAPPGALSEATTTPSSCAASSTSATPTTGPSRSAGQQRQLRRRGAAGRHRTGRPDQALDTACTLYLADIGDHVQ